VDAVLAALIADISAETWGHPHLVQVAAAHGLDLI